LNSPSLGFPANFKKESWNFYLRENGADLGAEISEMWPEFNSLDSRGQSRLARE
jgi:hypothetical protein